MEIARDHYLDQLITFPAREDKTLDLIFTKTTGLANNCHSPDKFKISGANSSIPSSGSPGAKSVCSTKVTMTPYEANSKNSKNPSFSQLLRILITKKTGNYSSLRLRPQWTETFHQKWLAVAASFPGYRQDCAALSDVRIESTQNIRRLVTTGFTPYGAN